MLKVLQSINRHKASHLWKPICRKCCVSLQLYSKAKNVEMFGNHHWCWVSRRSFHSVVAGLTKSKLSQGHFVYLMWGCVRYLSTVSVPAQQAQLHTAADSGRTKSLIKKGPPQNNQYMFLEYFFSTYLALSDGLFFWHWPYNIINGAARCVSQIIWLEFQTNTSTSFKT